MCTKAHEGKCAMFGEVQEQSIQEGREEGGSVLPHPTCLLKVTDGFSRAIFPLRRSLWSQGRGWVGRDQVLLGREKNREDLTTKLLGYPEVPAGAGSDQMRKMTQAESTPG